MRMWKTVSIADNERALLYRRGRLESVLMPGLHRLWNIRQDLELGIYDITLIWFEHARAKWL